MTSSIFSLKSPELIVGKRFTDDRGTLQFINEIQLTQFKRFYLIENHNIGFVRAWHGHMLEGKAFIPVQGAFIVGVARLNSNAKPDHTFEPEKQVLDASSPSALLVPPGFANGLMSLTQGAKLMVLSTSTLEESMNDDYRFPYDLWNIWQIDYR
jgi:dTDP-4-dehydrorhamnose 3,5-epimerase-like enzyme